MKCRQKSLYCKYCFKACSIATAMEHAINYNNKKNYTAVTDTGVMYPQMLLLFYCHITHHKVITYQ